MNHDLLFYNKLNWNQWVWETILYYCFLLLCYLKFVNILVDTPMKIHLRRLLLSWVNMKLYAHLQLYKNLFLRQLLFRNEIIILPAITFAFASRVASASAAIARCNWTGNLTSFISTLKIFNHFAIQIKTNKNY